MAYFSNVYYWLRVNVHACSSLLLVDHARECNISPSLIPFAGSLLRLYVPFFTLSYFLSLSLSLLSFFGSLYYMKTDTMRSTDARQREKRKRKGGVGQKRAEMPSCSKSQNAPRGVRKASLTSLPLLLELTLSLAVQAASMLPCAMCALCVVRSVLRGARVVEGERTAVGDAE